MWDDVAVSYTVCKNAAIARIHHASSRKHTIELVFEVLHRHLEVFRRI